MNEGLYIILCVGCHPDDLEIAVAGTICYFLKKGYEVICIYLTKGECSGDPGVREQESRDACRILGIKPQNIFFGPFKDTQIPQKHEVIAYLEGFVNEHIYAAFIPSVHEVHQDHRNASYSCITAFRHVPRLFAYESPTITPEFRPNAFVDINGHIEEKRRALECYKSQLAQHKMYLEYNSMIQLAAFRGHQSGVEYAEAFETQRNLLEPASIVGEMSGRSSCDFDKV